jgi:endoglucanase
MKIALISSAAMVTLFSVSGCEGTYVDLEPQAVDVIQAEPAAKTLAVAASKPFSNPGAEPAAAGSILLNQHGFPSHANLRAVLVDASAVSKPFELLNDRGQVVLSGQTVPFGTDAASGLSIHQINAPLRGVFGNGLTVSVGAISSAPFDVGGKPYADLSRDSLSYFYHARVGQPIEAAYVRTRTPALTRPAGHSAQTLSCFSGTDNRGTVWPGCDYTLPIEGGWYDAGDYGQYAGSTGFATWMLLNMAERRKGRRSGQCVPELGDMSLNIPEAGNGVSDILDEARLGVNYLLSMQINSTTPQPLARGAQAPSGALTLTSTVPTGMVHHKSHGTVWPSDDVGPHEDTTDRRLYPPTTSATLHLAAVGAQCARAFSSADRAFAETCLTAAQTAYAAASRVSDAYAWNAFSGGGAYEDDSLNDEFAWAATELWLATGDASYAADIDRYAGAYNPDGSFNWSSVEALGILSLVRAERAIQDHPRLALAKSALLSWADRYEAQSSESGFMIPKSDATYYWGSNGNFANHSILMATAHSMTGDDKYRRGVADTMDYLLGRNALGQSYISGYGEQTVRNPHHRYWQGATDPTRPLPPPGVLSGGPNNTTMVDPVAATMRGNCTGMTCWADEYDGYSLNEVTIVWNASLAWVAHWMDRQDAHCSGSPRPVNPDAL